MLLAWAAADFVHLLQQRVEERLCCDVSRTILMRYQSLKVASFSQEFNFFF